MTSPYRTWSTPPTRLQADCLRCRSRGMSPTETAEVFGITRSRVESALRTAKEPVRGALQRCSLLRKARAVLALVQKEVHCHFQ